jgi:hypothetical protein
MLVSSVDVEDKFLYLFLVWVIKHDSVLHCLLQVVTSLINETNLSSLPGILLLYCPSILYHTFGASY